MDIVTESLNITRNHSEFQRWVHVGRNRKSETGRHAKAGASAKAESGRLQLLLREETARCGRLVEKLEEAKAETKLRKECAAGNFDRLRDAKERTLVAVTELRRQLDGRNGQVSDLHDEVALLKGKLEAANRTAQRVDGLGKTVTELRGQLAKAMDCILAARDAINEEETGA